MAWIIILAVSNPLWAESLYTWTDKAGVKHYQQADIEVDDALKQEFSSPLYAVDWVPDGDTLHLKNGWKIRLIGINTPEIAKRGYSGQWGGEAARRFLVEWVEQSKVRLVYDVERFDRYGRRLAYVYTEDGKNINAEIIRKGLGHVNIVPPNIRQIRALLVFEEQARNNRLGLWNSARYRQLDLNNLNVGLGFKRIKGVVKKVRVARKYVYLEFNKHFSARIKKDHLRKIVTTPEDLVDKELRLRGWVKKKGRHKMLELKHFLQVEGGCECVSVGH